MLTHAEAIRVKHLYAIRLREIGEAAGKSQPWAHHQLTGTVSPSDLFAHAVNHCAAIYRDAGVRPAPAALALHGPDPMEADANHAAPKEWAPSPDATPSPSPRVDAALAAYAAASPTTRTAALAARALAVVGQGGPPYTSARLHDWLTTTYGQPATNPDGWRMWRRCPVYCVHDGATWLVAGHMLHANVAGPYLWCLHNFPTTK